MRLPITAHFSPRLMGALLLAAGAASTASAAPVTPTAPATPVTPAPAATPAASAQTKSQATPPADEPNTQVISDSLRYDDNKRESTFIGNVVATRGQLNIYADQLVVSEDKAGNQFGTATANQGKLVTLTEDRPETFEHIEGKGLRAEYDGTKSQFDLIGQAVVIRYICGKPYDTIRGQRVRYYQKTDVYEAQGGPGSPTADGRVHSLAEPRSKTQAAIAACAAAKNPAKAAPATPPAPAHTPAPAAKKTTRRTSHP